MPATKYKFEISNESQGKRLDQAIPFHVEELSRRKARKLLQLGAVFVDGKRTKVASRQLRKGQEVVVTVSESQDRVDQVPQHEIIHEDKDLLVVNKPAGLHSVPTPESDQGNLEWQLKQSRSQLWTIHRLDMATSGLLVFAKSKAALKILNEQMLKRAIERVYHGLVEGCFEREHTERTPIGGKEAVTHLQPLQSWADKTLVEARLETGRTHQIRIHCANIGHPILGDKKYGGPRWSKPYHALHAHTLSFKHLDGTQCHFSTPWSGDPRDNV